MKLGKNVFTVLAAALMVLTLSMPFAAEAKKKSSKKAKTSHSQVSKKKKGGKHAKKSKKKKPEADMAASSPATQAPAGGEGVGVVEPPPL